MSTQSIKIRVTTVLLTLLCHFKVSKSTAQLVLACKVKAREGSRAMEGLKTASDAVRRATDALVKAAQGSVQKPTSPRVKVDRFKQVDNIIMKSSFFDNNM